MSPEDEAMSYASKQALQETQYDSAYHWDDTRRVEASRYRRLTAVIGGLIVERANLTQTPVGAICDFGCGDGRGTMQLAEAFAGRHLNPVIVGADLSERAVAWARKQVAAAGARDLRFMSGSIEDALAQLPVTSGSGLYVVMREVVEHLEDRDLDHILQRIRQARPEASVVITTPSTNSPVARKHLRHYTTASLTATHERNGYTATVIGFGFRPKSLYGPLVYLKSLLNRAPVAWMLMNPAWRTVSPNHAITLIAVASVTGRQPNATFAAG